MIKSACQPGNCKCDERPWVPESVETLPMPDLMVGQRVLELMQQAFGAIDVSVELWRALSVEVCFALPSNVMVGCTELGREFVQEMKAGQV